MESNYFEIPEFVSGIVRPHLKKRIVIDINELNGNFMNICDNWKLYPNEFFKSRIIKIEKDLSKSQPAACIFLKIEILKTDNDPISFLDEGEYIIELIVTSSFPTRLTDMKIHTPNGVFSTPSRLICIESVTSISGGVHNATTRLYNLIAGVAAIFKYYQYSPDFTGTGIINQSILGKDKSCESVLEYAKNSKKFNEEFIQKMK